ncbi:MAG: DNA polymerase III subunit gamma/tau [Acidobacteriota bacterium]|nr:DNA polymerase III subunit gamma/tau [Acidobacteriota bacterium]
MSYTVLARKYRPQKFADVIGQDHVVRTLQNALEQKRIAHGYIFSGHRGIGKTTIARILAMALNCKSSPDPVSEPCGVCDSCREIRDGSVGAMDVIEIDAATNRGIEEVRGLIATATAEPARDRYRIFILDEAHQVTDAAFNALLKTLEEPPSWAVFMMATTQPEDIPQTIRSRCQHFSFHAVRFEEILNHLRDIAKTENLTVDEEALALLAEAGDGSMRDALSIMDQAISCSGNVLSGEVVRSLIGNVSSEVLERVMLAVHANSGDEVLRIIDKLMVEGQSATHFARQLVRFLRNALVAKVAGADSPVLQISSDEKKRVSGIAELFSEEDLTRFLQIMLRTFGDVSYKQEQRFHLELGLLKLVHAQRLLPLEQLLSGVSLVEAAPAQRSASTSHGVAPAASHAAPPRTPPPGFTSRPSGVPPLGGGNSPFGKKPSPFEADTARKGREDLSAAPVTPMAQAPSYAPQAAPAFAAPIAIDQGALAVAPRIEASAPASSAPLDVDALREAVLHALEGKASQMLVQAMEEGEWAAEGHGLTVKVEMSDSMISISYTRDQEKAANQAAARAAGRPCKVRLLGGAAPAAERKPRAVRAGGGEGFKTRAMEEPVVKRMIEKFTAEVRIIMDRSEED